MCDLAIITLRAASSGSIKKAHILTYIGARSNKVKCTLCFFNTDFIYLLLFLYQKNINSKDAKFQLVAAMNASNEAYSGGQDYYQSSASQKYLRKLSAPFLDRIDLHVEVPPLPTDVLVNQSEMGEASSAVRQRVEAAVARQRARQGVQNAQLSGRELERICALSESDKLFMQQALERLKLSARAYHRVLRVALTLADLESVDVARKHLMESLSYRKMEKMLATVVGGA